MVSLLYSLFIFSNVLLTCFAFSNSKIPLFSLSDIDDYAKLCGLQLKVQPKGPFLKIEAFPIQYPEESIGYLTAFIRPLPLFLFQLDTIQVENRRQTLGFQRRGYSVEGPGISFIMGSYALRWAYDRGCRTTQLLAVKDSEEMHRTLVRLYSSFGFKVLKYLDDTVDSVTDRLVWGAEGSLMGMDIPTFLTEWTPKLRVMIDDKRAETASQEQD